MNLAQDFAGRSRKDASHAFTLANVSATTKNEAPPNLPSSAHAWKFWARLHFEEEGHGPDDVFCFAVWAVLLDHTDASGRTWISFETLRRKSRVGSEHTLRKALRRLVDERWLRVEGMTWAQLAKEQAASGRPLPSRDDEGQAPNLYTLLDGTGNEFGSARTAATTKGPGIARTAQQATATQLPPPPQICGGPPPQIQLRPPPADLPPDLDPGKRSLKEERAEGVPPPPRSTHHSRKISGKGQGWVEAWRNLEKAHAQKALDVYGVTPLPAKMRQEEREAMAESLEGVALELRAQVLARIGLERPLEEVRRELAERVMRLYFKRKNRHLETVHHAIADLYREFTARLGEAKREILLETHDNAPPRKALAEPVTPEAQAEQAQVVEALGGLCAALAPPGERRRVDVAELGRGAPRVSAPSTLRAWKPSATGEVTRRNLGEPAAARA